MGREIAWTDAARRQLRGIDRDSAMRVLHGLARFAATGEGDVKRLQEIDPPEYRLRVGEYRVRFRDEGGVIVIGAVRHRREAYR